MGVIMTSVTLAEKELSGLFVARIALLVLFILFAIVTVVLYIKLNIYKILKFQKDNRNIIKMKSIPAIADDKEIQKIQKQEQRRLKKEKKDFEQAWQTALLSGGDETAALDHAATDLLFAGTDETAALDHIAFQEQNQTDMLGVDARTEMLDENMLGLTEQLDATTKLSDDSKQNGIQTSELHFTIEKDIEIYENN